MGVDALDWLYLPELTEVGDFIVLRNDALVGLDIGSLQHVAGDLRVAANDSLSSAAVQSSLAGVEVDGETVICGNAGEPACIRACP